MEIKDYVRPLKRLAKIPHTQLGGVACFFIKNHAIISSGINHNPTGKPMDIISDGKTIAHPAVVHAEIAAITAASQNHIDLTDSTLLLTTAPCIKCARAIAHTHIKALYYLYDWWDQAALDLLRAQNIKIIKLKEITHAKN